MRFSRLLPKIILSAGFLLLFLIIAYQNRIKDFLNVNFDKAKEYVNYVSYDVNFPFKRVKPLSLLTRETELKLYIGEPFRSFSKGDWEKFWNIIYGIFPMTNPKQPGLKPKRRQLTEDEIANKLIREYPQPFGYFQPEHWKIFFGIVIKK